MSPRVLSLLLAATAAPVLATMPLVAAQAAPTAPTAPRTQPQRSVIQSPTDSDRDALNKIVWTAAGASCTKTVDDVNFNLTCTDVSNPFIGDEVWVGFPASPFGPPGPRGIPYVVTTTVNQADPGVVLETKEEDVAHTMIAHNYLGQGQSSYYNGTDITFNRFGWGIGINSVSSLPVKSVTINVHLDSNHATRR